MISSKYKWNLGQLTLTPKIKAIADELKVTPLLIAILWQRGIQTIDDIQNFLNPSPDQLRNPFLIHDMKKGIDRILDAVAKDEKITIYGDYDADGITSTAILYESLLELGANVDYYIPDRFKDGYGPNRAVFQKLIDGGTNLIVTVDNGIVGNQAVDLANQNGCDVIISDHHNLPPQLPNAYAIIHARFPGDEYPFGDFSGAGIAFKIASAILDEIPQEQLDLATIGTVADLVSLTGENRVIVKFGFEALKMTQRPGLAALIDKAGLTGKSINEHQIGFQIAPRLNSLGRMGDANIGVELLTTIDPERGQELAELTDAKNKERQQLVSSITKEAMEQAQSDENQKRHTLVIAGNDWHEGVLGIVASRIVDRFHKPTLVLTRKKGDCFKGSGRSIEGFDLFDSLTSIRDQMDKFGGHEMAVGLTVPADHLKPMSDHLEAYYLDHHSDKVVKPPLSVTGQLSIDQIDMNFYHDLQRMAPFGSDNDQPIFEIIPQSIDHLITMGKSNQHLKMLIHQDKDALSVVGFQKGELIDQLKRFNSHLAVVGKINLNEWQGKQSLQLLMVDLMINGVDLIDSRTNVLKRSMFSDHQNYVFFHPKIAEQVQPFITNGGQIMIADQIPKETNLDDVVIVDCPNQIDELKHLLNRVTTPEITFYFYHRNGKITMPNRQNFAQLFKLLTHYHTVDLKKQLNSLINDLKVSKNLLIFMLQVFRELNFIVIDHQVVQVVDQPDKKALQSANVYQLRLQQIKTAEYLFGDRKQLFTFIKNHLNDEG